MPTNTIQTVALHDEESNLAIQIAAGAPTASTAGYAPGALYLRTDGADGSRLYVNNGSKTSATWTPFSADATATVLATLSSLTATAAEINRVAIRSARVVDCTASTLAVTEALHDGRIITLNRAGGIAVTLPTAAAGLRFRFIVGTTFTGAATIKSATGADIMIGHALMGNNSDNTVVDWPATAGSTFDTIDLLGTANSTGGMAGQEIEIIGLAANLWFVTMRGDASGTEAAPWADTVT